MNTWLLSKGTKAALVDIYDYTSDKWGARQAGNYLNGMLESFKKICNRKTLWRPIPDEFETKGFVTRYKQHYIYWKQFPDGGIGIVAILHVSMMQGERLTKAFDLLESE
ncbi:MAG: type II toxin-antitoxin system RelE/ParE family toxin [Alphaproteobacteria bacterium]|nr:type II toxin-antitoxin system RelE/ParE family toxin [Alphaproteobacteria bacterium]